MFGVTRTSDWPTDAEFAVARMQANAAQAYRLGLGRVAAEAPPPLYAYDPDVGRLAVTTPAYNTAIVTVNQRAFPYGGVELARLFDGDQRIAANIGGRPPASFGVLVRNRRTGHETATQHGRLHPDLAHPPLRLLEAPRGAVEHPIAYPVHAYAGPFTRLAAVGTTTGPGVTVRTRHRFTADAVETSWRVLPAHDQDDPHDVGLLFPSTGADAAVTAVLRDGRRLTLTEASTPKLADIAWLHLGGRDCGYVVVVRSRALPGTARISRPRAQSSAPQPGPTVVFELLHDRALRPLVACVRVAPARDLAEAERVARALGAGH